ncbi:MAG: hypothetical protein LCH51_09000 [Bacteroidetes bacterium]|nr:hypothetical protein [Bacteroidota bacterium]
MIISELDKWNYGKTADVTQKSRFRKKAAFLEEKFQLNFLNDIWRW